MTGERVLIIEDEATLRETLSDLIELEGLEPACAASLAEADRKFSEAPVDVVVIDRQLPDGDGIEHAFEQGWVDGQEVIVLTGSGSIESAVECLARGVSDYLTKPLERDRLRAALAKATRSRALKDEVRDLRGELRRRGRFGSIVGRSAVMQDVFDQVARVAPTDASVLIVGESGTGKEVVASTLHSMSPRRRGPWVAVNCGAIPENLIESELFGHEKGSFTGAVEPSQGCFRRASGGTLFLDEITEMPIDLQVKLLRALETRVVQPIGKSEPVPVDVRILAACNRDPAQAIAEGNLREDLYYRLAVFPIQLPALRERTGDVELLAKHFLEELNQEADSPRALEPEALRELATHGWPGNVRELRNVVQRLFILNDRAISSTDGALDEEPPAMNGPAVPARGTPTEEHDGRALKEVRDEAVATAEREYIHGLLVQTAGNLKKTAERGGIGARALHALMKRRDLRKEDYR